MTKKHLSLEEFSQKQLEALRRKLHACPELDFDLEETSGIVGETLTALGISWKFTAKSGIAAVIEGEKPGRTVLLRADMDALPLAEEAEVPWRSRNEGVMHACGHDVHTACLLGAAEALSKRRKGMKGRVLLAFQPAEETSGGALPMIEDGLFGEGTPDGAFALHCDPSLPAGSVGAASGVFRAASDMFDASVRGRGTHGAEPHRGDDVIALACRVIGALHELVGRTVSPTKGAVLSVGTFRAGQARNILPERADFSGILRTLDEDVRESLRAKIRRTVMNIPNILGAVGEVTFTEGYPLLRNDEGMTEIVRNAARDLLGSDRTVGLTEPGMAVDDFAVYLQHMPGCYFLLGTGREGKDNPPLHNPFFDPDESCLPAGAAVLAEASLRFLEEPYQK